jgi:hypothetical protein
MARCELYIEGVVASADFIGGRPTRQAGDNDVLRFCIMVKN